MIHTGMQCLHKYRVEVLKVRFIEYYIMFTTTSLCYKLLPLPICLIYCDNCPNRVSFLIYTSKISPLMTFNVFYHIHNDHIEYL